MTLQKAEIFQKDKPSEKLVCQFNPKDFSITRAVKWHYKAGDGKDVGEYHFAGGEAQDLSVELWFDTTDDGSDVRKKYAKLLSMALIDESKANAQTHKGEPPQCIFQWGSYLSFTGVIKQISQNFTFFKSDGTPLRAKVGVTFSETALPKKKTNPTSRTEAKKTWVIHEGQSLDWIAFQEYGSPAHWRHIAEVNDLADPMHLQPGQVLKLTPL